MTSLQSVYYIHVMFVISSFTLDTYFDGIWEWCMGVVCFNDTAECWPNSHIIKRSFKHLTTLLHTQTMTNVYAYTSLRAYISIRIEYFEPTTKSFSFGYLPSIVFEYYVRSWIGN